MTDDDDPTSTPPTESQRLRHDREWSSGVPVVKRTPFPLPPPDEDTTSPIALLDKPVRDDERELAHRILRMTSDDPRQMAFLLAKLMRRGVDHQSGSRDLGTQMAELRRVLETMPTAGVERLQDDIDKIELQVAAIPNRILPLENSSKFVKWAGALIIGALIGSVTYVADRISSYSETRGRQTEQIDTLRETIKSLERNVRRLELSDARRDKGNDHDP